MGDIVTRYPNGVGNVSEVDILADMGQLDPTKFHTFFEDFDTYAITDGTNAQWTETLNSGTIAMSAANGGALVLTCANTDEAITQTQRTRATFQLTSGKKTFFKARFKVADADLTDVFVGLSVIDTAIIAASAIDVTDAVGFFKAATATSLTFYARKNATTGSTSAASIGTVADDTYMTVGFYYDGISKIYYMFNDVVLGSVDGSSTYLPDTVITPSLAVGQEGTGGANVMTVDYVFVAQER